MGTLETINKQRGKFDDEDQDLLLALGAQAAIAIENARLFQESDLISEFVHEIRTPLASLTAAAYILMRPEIPEERRANIIQTMQQECLDHFIVFGERHMNHLVKEMVEFYHESRPHQAKDNDLLVPAADAKKAEEPDVARISGFRCKKRLGGVLKHYYRKVA